MIQDVRKERGKKTRYLDQTTINSLFYPTHPVVPALDSRNIVSLRFKSLTILFGSCHRDAGGGLVVGGVEYRNLMSGTFVGMIPECNRSGPKLILTAIYYAAYSCFCLQLCDMQVDWCIVHTQFYSGRGGKQS